MAEASPSVELILCEIGLGPPEPARLEPLLGTFRVLFPEARVVLHADEEGEIEGVEVCRAETPFDPDGPHYATRARDYARVRGLLRSEARVAVAMEADMRIVSEAFRTLVPLVERFGLAVAASPRLLVATDAALGEDASEAAVADTSGGKGFAYARSPLALDTRHEQARSVLEAYLRLMEEEPARGPLVLWRAAWETGFPPYVLPFTWCLGSPSVLTSKHMRGEEIVLRTGEPGVVAHFRRSRTRLAVKRMFRGAFGGGAR